jgi:predicted esterase
LHGNNSNAGAMQEYWEGLRRTGWLVALPQSSQIVARNLFVWNDMIRVEKEVAQHMQSLESRFTLSNQQGLILGFSKGGHAAIHCALKSIVPVNGFVALAPYVGDPQAVASLWDSGRRSTLKGYFILGEQDRECNPGAIKLADLLPDVGVPCRCEVVAEIAHAIPDDLDQYLVRARKFILGEEPDV